jgi:Uma2 family endonuclease
MSTLTEPANDVQITGRVRLFKQRISSAQFIELPECDAVRLELWEGYVTMAARPSLHHQYFMGRLFAALSEWVEENELGRLLMDSLMELSEETTVAPDVLYLAAEHLDRAELKRIVGPIDLAVEILSPSDRRADRVVKKQKYAEAGIPWYWIVDLEARVLEEYPLKGEKHGTPRKAPFDRPFEPRVFPGLKLDLAAMEWK